MMKSAEDILKKIFGYEEFRPLQAEIISAVLQKKDILAIMPTGSGKSLCYQIPALIFQGLTIVVSPLISLMKDQVEQLQALNIPALYLNSTLSYPDYQSALEKIKNGTVKLLYVAPETLLKPNVLSLLIQIQVDCLAIDEAHCISFWGHDFRPEYRKLIAAKQNFKQAVCIAITATATPRVQNDIKNSLELTDAGIFISSFNRPNLFLSITQKNNPKQQTIEFLKKFPQQSGIIYCFSRKQVDQLAQELNKLGYSVKPYHSGLSDEERMRNQELFINDDVQIIVATIAFGMGINKPNVRFVIHYDLPQSIENYYQEIGRAGRDGLEAHCLLLFGYSDIQKIKYFIEQKEPKEKQVALYQLKSLLNFVETNICRRINLLNYFGEKYHETNCRMCDFCTEEPIEFTDITIPAQKFLSCIKRTGEIFGVNYIIDILRGSKAKKIIEQSHDQLSTYGIGKEYTKEQWINLFQQFLQKGLIVKDWQYGSLKLNARSYAIFRGQEKVMGEIIENIASKEIPEMQPVPYNQKLFDLLKQARKQLADHEKVPPYVIFPDKTLIEMATFFPQSRKSLSYIYGIGSIKLEKYGDIFIDLIYHYCLENHITEITKKPKETIIRNENSIKPHKYIQIGNDFNLGKSFEQLLTENQIKPVTLINHLYKYVKEGHQIISNDKLLTLLSKNPVNLNLIFTHFKNLGTDYLKPVFLELKETVEYNDLAILRIYYLTNLASSNLRTT